MIEGALDILLTVLVLAEIVVAIVTCVFLITCFVWDWYERRRRRRPTVSITISANVSKAQRELAKAAKAINVMGGGSRGPGGQS